MTEVPHLAFPLELADDGGLMQVEQDELPDVRQCVYVLLRTPVGARPLAPEIGVEDPTFSTGVDPDAITTLIDVNEPRADATVTATTVDETGAQQVQIVVELANQPPEDA